MDDSAISRVEGVLEVVVHIFVTGVCTFAWYTVPAELDDCYFVGMLDEEVD